MEKPRDSDNELIALMPTSDLLELAIQAGYTADSLKTLLEKVGLPTNLFERASGYAEPDEFWRLFSAMGVELDDEQFGLGEYPMPSGTTELLIARALHEKTLGKAMTSLAHAANIVYRNLEMRITHRQDETRVALKFNGASTKAQQILLELTCIPYHSIFCWLVDASLQAKRIRTAAFRSTSTVSLLAIFDCALEFHGDGVEIRYSKDVEALPVANKSLRNWRNDLHQVFLQNMVYRKKNFLASEMRFYVESALRKGITSQSAIAASAAMSVATLRRKLSIERTSFRALSDQVLHERVLDNMETGLSFEAIAEQLGYSDSRSFRRAFRRVFGKNPSDLKA